MFPPSERQLVNVAQADMIDDVKLQRSVFPLQVKGVLDWCPVDPSRNCRSNAQRTRPCVVPEQRQTARKALLEVQSQGVIVRGTLWCQVRKRSQYLRDPPPGLGRRGIIRQGRVRIVQLGHDGDPRAAVAQEPDLQ